VRSDSEVERVDVLTRAALRPYQHVSPGDGETRAGIAATEAFEMVRQIEASVDREEARKQRVDLPRMLLRCESAILSAIDKLRRLELDDRPEVLSVFASTALDELQSVSAGIEKILELLS